MSEPAVELRDVSLRFRSGPVLDHVSLRIDPRDYVALLGPNGGGKTTLLRVILGLLTPDEGEVRVLGTSPRQARGRVGYVPQHARFDREFPIRVVDVVLMGRLARRRLFQRYTAEDRDRAVAALGQVDLAPLAGREIGRLSGGELQRVLIARALTLEPELLLLDEPMSSLDEVGGRGLWDLLQELSQRLTVIVVSHDVGAISQHVRGIACLNQRLHYHPSGKLTPEILEQTYGCPIDLVAHGHPHRVLGPHDAGHDT